MQTEATNNENSIKVTPAEVKPERKPLNKKQRIILIAVISVVVALALAGGITAAVLLTRGSGNDKPMEKPSRRMQYSYYIDKNDTEGFYLDQAFRADVPLESLEREEKLHSDSIVLDADLKLRVAEAAEAQSNAQYVYYYNDQEIAVINITVTTIDAKISTAGELSALSGSGIYALSEDIDMSGAESIASFYGTLYGNHHKIKGLTQAGGLFREVVNAQIIGLDFVDVNVNAVVGAGNYGVLAGVVRNSEISYCSVKGKFDVNATTSKQDIVYVGGIAGYITAIQRTEPTSAEKKITQCVSYLDLSVTARGDVKVGGLAGGVLNATVRECYAYGKTELKASDASTLGGVYFGGIAGIVSKQYDLVNTFNSLDEGNRIYCYSDLSVDIKGDNAGITVYAGGIYGMMMNQSIANVKFIGKMDIATGKVSLDVGGLVGSAVNDTGLTMNIRGAEVGGAIRAYSLRDVAAGGLAGVFEGTVSYEKVLGSVNPTVDTDYAGNTGIHKTSEGVAQVK